MCLKTSQGKNSLIHLFAFCGFAWLRLCAFGAFGAFGACKIFSLKKNKGLKLL